MNVVPRENSGDFSKSPSIDYTTAALWSIPVEVHFLSIKLCFEALLHKQNLSFLYLLCQSSEYYMN
jgi:hypothetical protein